MQPGDVIAGRFVIEALAGAGGMGQVFRAQDRERKETVAIKVVRSERAPEARFVREARLLAQLNHPCIVGHVAHGRCADGLYIAMEWLEGKDLRDRLDEQPLSLSAALELSLSVARALALAHSVGIVHRDIKPRNVFLLVGDPTRV